MEDLILEYNILNAVHESDGNLTQRHLSEGLGRSVSSVNFALRLLAAKGYITILGSNPRKLMYHLTPTGLLQKSVLAYKFLKQQRALYDGVRKDLLEKLKIVTAEGAKSASLYGWTPFTEVAILYLIFEGIHVVAIYVSGPKIPVQWNKIPFRFIEDFQNDSEVVLAMEPLPQVWAEKIKARKILCYPDNLV